MKKEFKTPKVLEKKPVIAGFDLSTIVVLTSASLLFVFTIFKSFLMALSVGVLAILYVKVKRKYPQKGQLIMIIRYASNIQCVRFNQSIASLLKRH